MRAAGVEAFSRGVKLIDVGDPTALEPDELLVDVRAAGVGNWDNFARVGEWDLGRRPPLALGVEAAGRVSATGREVGGFTPGDRVLVHSAPLRYQGAWAEQFVAPASATASLPSAVSFETAGGFPVPALTADQALQGIGISQDDTLLVHGAGGVTGNLLVQLGALAGAKVVATASERTARRSQQSGARSVVDYRSPGWVADVRDSTGGRGVDAAVNAVPGGASTVLDLVRDNGRLATITSDPPPTARGVGVRRIDVSADGDRLRRLAGTLASGAINLEVSALYPLEAAADALEQVLRGSGGGTVVLWINESGGQSELP
jgi:NADPH:quinone reductase-like Zn-dependent oxidoreductase